MFIPIPIILFVTIIYLSVTNKNESLVVKTISTSINNFSKLPRKTQMIQITKVIFVTVMKYVNQNWKSKVLTVHYTLSMTDTQKLKV